MEKIKNILILTWTLLTGLFYVLLKSKDRKIEKQQSEIDKTKQDNETLKTAINVSSSTDSIVDELRKRGEYDD